MNSQTVDLDYCGIVILLRQLVSAGVCTKSEAKKVAERIAKEHSVNIIYAL